MPGLSPLPEGHSQTLPSPRWACAWGHCHSQWLLEVLMSVGSVCPSHSCAMLVASSHPVIPLLHLCPSPLLLQAEEPAAEAQNSCEEPGRPFTSTQRREGRRNEVWRLILAASHMRKIKNSGQQYKKGGKLLRACSWKPRQPWFMHPARYFCTYLN